MSKDLYFTYKKIFNGIEEDCILPTTKYSRELKKTVLFMMDIKAVEAPLKN